MREITSLELGFVAAELRSRVVGSFIKKFYDLGNGAFRMSFHGSEGNVEVYINLLHAINETRFKEEVGEATNFAMAVRKRIENSKVLDISQHGSDRILIIDFGTREGKYRMLIEMFGKGNLLVLDESSKIVLCYKIIEYKDRTIRPGSEYVLPKGESIDVNTIKEAGVREIVSGAAGSGSKMITDFSKRINIGPMYLDEIIRGAGLNPKDPLGESEVDRLSESFNKFFGDLAHSKPTLYLEAGRPVDYSLVQLKKYSGMERKEFASLSELLDEMYIGSRHAKPSEDSGAMEELDITIGKQKDLVRQFSEESRRSAEAAKEIFGHMNDINSVIYYMNQNKRATVDEVRKEFPKLRIDKINLKDKKIVLEI